MRGLVVAAGIAMLPLSVHAGAIERACLQSGRDGANRAVCGCIQQAADLTLSRRDQNRAAKVFRNPEQAQQIRQSARARDAEFWERYSAFGDTAEAFCG